MSDSYASKLSELEKKFSKDKTLDEPALQEIDEIRSLALENRTLSESCRLVEKSNELLTKYYESRLSSQIGKLAHNSSYNELLEFVRLRYITTHINERKSMKQIENEGLNYANDVISAGNKLAVILGVAPLE